MTLPVIRTLSSPYLKVFFAGTLVGKMSLTAGMGLTAYGALDRVQNPQAYFLSLGGMMTSLPSRFVYISYFLILYLVTQPFSLWAGPASMTGAVVEKRLAVLEIHDGQVKKEIVGKVADTVRDELVHQGKFNVISKSETERFFKDNPQRFHWIDPSNPLNRYLDQAKELYKTFSFKDAVEVLENTITTYRESQSVRDQIFLLTEAYLMLGNVYLGAGNKRKALNAFQEAVRLDPERELTERQYPPKTVRLHREIRKKYLAGAKSLPVTVKSSPGGSQVYFNGVVKGVTPLEIRRFTEGEHYIVVKKEGYQSKGKMIQLQRDAGVVKFALEKSPERFGVSSGYLVSDLRDIPEQVRIATATGKLMEADKIILISVQEVGWNYKISARMIDVGYGASHKHKSVEVLNFPEDSREAAKLLAADINEKAHLDLAKDPKKYADSEVVVIGKKKKKSILKSPILWSIVGVLIAGGAASAVLLSGGGGGEDQSTINVSGSTSQAP